MKSEPSPDWGVCLMFKVRQISSVFACTFLVDPNSLTMFSWKLIQRELGWNVHVLTGNHCG